MATRIELPSGRSVVIDETTGDIITEEGSAQISDGGAGLDSMLPPPPTADGGFDPAQDDILDLIKLPDGSTQVTYSRNGQQQRAVIPAKTSGGGGGGATQGQLLSAQQQQAALAQDNEQFYQTMGYNKARYNTDFNESKRQFDAQFGENQRQFNASQDLTKGNTLLGLGSRPDTLIKYLYALRGQQTPQGFQNTTAALPGYQGLIGQPNYGPAQAPALGAAAPAIAAPAAAPALTNGVDPRVTAVKAAIRNPAADLSQFVQPGGTTITRTDPRQSATPPQGQTILSGAATATQGATNEQLGAQDALISAGRKPRFYSNGVAIFGEGGVIPERVLGIGESGQRYEFGEEGTEVVVPKDKVPKDVFERLMQDAQEVDYTEDKTGKRQVKVKRAAPDIKSYANGGTIGYDPTSLFNPGASNIFNGNIGSQFPQVDHFTGGGQSLVPSAQKLTNSLGSEREFYSGFLTDEAGVVPGDIFELAGRMAPKVRGLTTPRYV